MFYLNEYHRRSRLKSLYDIDGLRRAVQIQGTPNYRNDTDIVWMVEVSRLWGTISEHIPRESVSRRRGDSRSKQEPNINSAYRDADELERWLFSLGFHQVKEAKP